MEKTLDGRDPGSQREQNEQHEITGLQQRHQELERRLAVLDGHLALTAAEQVERVRLKKEKLQVKDRLLVLSAAQRPH
jgi:uncharacterized protein YdcH (DUF465 family)